jgi:small-conductance mechanosensitive channel
MTMNLYGKHFDWLYFAQNNTALSVAVVVVGAMVLGYGVYQVGLFILRNRLKRSDFMLFELLRKHAYHVGLLVFIGLGLVLLIPLLHLPKEWLGPVNKGLAIYQILCTALLFIQVIGGLRAYALYRYNLALPGSDHRFRAVYTQYRIFERILVCIIVIFAIIAALMTFESVRRFGVSLLASAGVVGVIVGFAAQKSIATVLAGIQIAIAQPIRMDDVVVVEGEWGRVEEITLTYVVVRIWDERRLVVPIAWFLDKPFYNWTRLGTELQGVVVLMLDFMAPVETIRTVFKETLEGSPLWDRRVAILQVTGATDRIMEVRLLVSATNADQLFDLRCLVRERLYTFLAANHPDALPRNRVQSVDNPNAIPVQESMLDMGKPV